MYKDRIKKWGLEKNIKEHEALAVANTKYHRDIIGKKTVVQKHSQAINVQRFLNHVKRKRLQASSGGELTSVPSYMVCRTPSPVPVLPSSIQDTETDLFGFGAWQALDGRSSFTAVGYDNFVEEVIQVPAQPSFVDEESLQSTIYEINKICRSLSQTPSISPTLSTPQTLRVPEQLLYNIKALYAGSFESRAWVVDEDGKTHIRPTNVFEYSSAVFDFRDLCYSAVALKLTGSLLDFRRVLSKAFSVLRDVLRAYHPRTIDMILEVLLHFRLNGLSEVVPMLCNFMRDLSPSICSNMGRWRRVFELFSRLDEASFSEAISTSWQCTSDAVETHAGRFGESDLMSRLDFIATVYGRDLFEAERLLRILLAQWSNVFPVQNARILYAMVYNLYTQGRYLEAEELGLDVETQAKNPGSRTSVGVHMATVTLVAKSQYYQSKVNLAEASLKRSTQLGVCRWGQTNPRVVENMLTLETWLRGWARGGEADELRVKINGLIGLDMTDLEQNG